MKEENKMKKNETKKMYKVVEEYQKTSDRIAKVYHNVIMMTESYEEALETVRMLNSLVFNYEFEKENKENGFYNQRYNLFLA